MNNIFGKRWLLIAATAALVLGVAAIAAGSWGIFYTYSTVAAENITTPEDAAIPGKPVRGPLTLKAQADIIREHTLRATGGKTFAEMPRMVPKLDESGEPIIDESGKPVMVPNTARDLWVTATTLRTALQLGIFSYLLSTLTIILGIVSLATSWTFFLIHRNLQRAHPER